MSKTPMERYADYVEAELNRERAAVLGRFGARVEEALAECAALEAALGPEPDLATLEHYRRSRATARDALAAFRLQREALGLIDHTWVERIFPLPLCDDRNLQVKHASGVRHPTTGEPSRSMNSCGSTPAVRPGRARTRCCAGA